MMNKLGSLLFILIITAAIPGCKTDKHPLLPTVTGTAGHVTLVVDKADWDTEIGEEYRRIFSRNYEVLPQYEPVFDVMQVAPEDFSNVFKSNRNIVITKISPDYKKSKLLVQYDLWAKPQIVLTLYGANDDSIVSVLTGHDEEIIELINDMELKRLEDVNKNNQDFSIVKKLRDEHHLSLTVPKGYKLAVDSPDFVWLFYEEANMDVDQSVFIYYYDYTDTNTFTYDYLIAKRDKYMKKYVGGEVQGSYITTEKEFKPKLIEYSLRGERYVAELRGLWKMVNGISMGGPFVSITTLDERRNRVVTVEGMVYAAGYDKRNFVRQVEAVVYSLDLNY
jgi:hypothetical protein